MIRCAALLCLLLAGCVSQGPFPSLAPRPGEQLAIEEPTRAPAEVPPDAGLRLRVLELRRQAERGREAFDSFYPVAQTALRRAGAPGTDSWIEGEQALSRLEAARLDTTDALTQLDLLASGRADMATNAEDFDMITGVQEVVQQIADDQQTRIDRLRPR